MNIFLKYITIMIFTGSGIWILLKNEFSQISYDLVSRKIANTDPSHVSRFFKGNNDDFWNNNMYAHLWNDPVFLEQEREQEEENREIKKNYNQYKLEHPNSEEVERKYINDYDYDYDYDYNDDYEYEYEDYAKFLEEYKQFRLEHPNINLFDRNSNTYEFADDYDTLLQNTTMNEAIKPVPKEGIVEQFLNPTAEETYDLLPQEELSGNYDDNDNDNDNDDDNKFLKNPLPTFFQHMLIHIKNQTLFKTQLFDIVYNSYFLHNNIFYEKAYYAEDFFYSFINKLTSGRGYNVTTILNYKIYDDDFNQKIKFNSFFNNMDISFMNITNDLKYYYYIVTDPYTYKTYEYYNGFYNTLIRFFNKNIEDEKNSHLRGSVHFLEIFIQRYNFSVFIPNEEQFADDYSILTALISNTKSDNVYLYFFDAFFFSLNAKKNNENNDVIFDDYYTDIVEIDVLMNEYNNDYFVDNIKLFFLKFFDNLDMSTSLDFFENDDRDAEEADYKQFYKDFMHLLLTSHLNKNITVQENDISFIESIVKNNHFSITVINQTLFNEYASYFYSDDFADQYSISAISFYMSFYNVFFCMLESVLNGNIDDYAYSYDAINNYNLYKNREAQYLFFDFFDTFNMNFTPFDSYRYYKNTTDLDEYDYKKFYEDFFTFIQPWITNNMLIDDFHLRDDDNTDTSIKILYYKK